MKVIVKNIKNTLFWALFSNLDGFLQSIAHMNGMHVWELLSVQWLNNTANLLSVQLLHNTASYCQFSGYITLQVTVSSVVK